MSAHGYAPARPTPVCRVEGRTPHVSYFVGLYTGQWNSLDASPVNVRAITARHDTWDGYEAGPFDLPTGPQRRSVLPVEIGTRRQHCNARKQAIDDG